jgi:acetyl esterase/lipase
VTVLEWRIARSLLRRPPSRHPYGAHPHQTCDLHLPSGAGPHPVAVVLHGGYWQPPYTKLIMRPMCQDLARRGYAAWNVEYRRLGRDGGGWPMTFDDVAHGIDLLAELDVDLDLARVTLVGHSAGGQLALWAAGRSSLPAHAAGAAPRVVAERVLALAAVCDLPRAGTVAARLLGGDPAEVPQRWAQADPLRRIPLGVPVGLVHGTHDQTVDPQRSRDYAAAAQAAGAPVMLIETAGEHRDPIDPSKPAWRAAADWLGPG